MARAVAVAAFFACHGIAAVPAQQLDNSSVVRGIDAAVQARIESIAGYTVTEHYAIYRNNDEVHPVSEMTVKTTYKKETGKSYAIFSQSGSEILRKLILRPLLDNEKSINLPGKRERSWFTSANYEMKLKPGGAQRLDGRECLALDITPRQKAPNLIIGTLWVDARDYSIVRIEGTGSKSPSMWTEPTRMMRQYANVNGFAMASRAKAESNSFFFGRTILTIDYRDYEIQLRPAK